LAGQSRVGERENQQVEGALRDSPQHAGTIANPDISESEADIDISTDPITVAEVKQATKKLKSEKAPGDDEICTETLKAGGEEAARHLYQILQNIWETEQPPEIWKTQTANER